MLLFFKMNEPIMRRGLSPEGRKIREKHQGCLLNDEFGVTSQPIHKKIEKDFLKENVLRLKEIQAKCRTQESRPVSGSQPVKAIRPTNKDFSFKDINLEDARDEKEAKLNVRDGSAHSDYFSLPDEAQIEREPPHVLQSCVQNKISRSPPYEKFSAKVPGIVSLDKFNENIKASISTNSSQSYNIIRPTLRNSEILDQRNTNMKLKNDNSPPKFRESYPHSPSIRRNKITNMIEKIKSKQPACETNTEFIWKDIRKEHRNLFLNDDCLSIGTPRAPHLVSLKNTALSTQKDSGFHKKKSSVVRSHSLGRNENTRPKSVASHDFNSTYTLDPRPKSSSTTKLINVEQDFEEVHPLAQEPYKYEFPHTMYQTESLPNLSDMSEEITSNSKVSTDTPRNQLPNSSPAAVISDSQCTIDNTFGVKNICNGNETSHVRNHMPLTSIDDSVHSLTNMQTYKNACNRKYAFESSNERSEFPFHSLEPSDDFTYTVKDKPIVKKDLSSMAENHHPSSSSTIATDMSAFQNKDNANSDHRDEVENNEVMSADLKVLSLPNLGAIEKTSRINAPILTRKNHLNQHSQQPNNQKQGNNSLLRSKSSNNLHLAGEPPPNYKRGQLPKYLKTRKAEALRRLEAAAAIDPLCPPGHSPVPDHERRNTLHLLKKAQADVMRQLCTLPVAQDTLRVRKLKNDLETKLSQIEDGIGIFSQPKVYVLNDEE